MAQISDKQAAFITSLATRILDCQRAPLNFKRKPAPELLRMHHEVAREALADLDKNAFQSLGASRAIDDLLQRARALGV